MKTKKEAITYMASLGIEPSLSELEQYMNSLLQDKPSWRGPDGIIILPLRDPQAYVYSQLTRARRILSR